MLGDDPDPLVMTERVGFGTTSGVAREGVSALCREGQMVGQQKNGWTEKGQRRQGGTRQLRTDANFMKTCRCNAHDDMMKCNKQINHTTVTQNMAGIWSVGLGALQHPRVRTSQGFA